MPKKSTKKISRKRTFFTDYGSSLKVGDLVTSYGAGYFRISGITRRFYASDTEHIMLYQNKSDGKARRLGDEYNPLIQVTRLLNTNFEKSIKADECDGMYCTRLAGQELNKVKRVLKGNPEIERAVPARSTAPIESGTMPCHLGHPRDSLSHTNARGNA